jgi:hypothetical protein
MIKVEYLFPFNTKDGLCKNISSFNSLLSAHSDISIKKDKITFKSSSYNYKITLDEVRNQHYSVFHVIFDISRTTDKFRDMLKAIKKTVGVHVKDDIQIIWDGIGFEWSKALYPRIYTIENSLRKLISKFMLINLGIGWHKSSVPKEVKTSIKSPNFRENHTILYEIDFIQLAHFLFKPYSIKDINNLPSVISKMLDKKLSETEKKEIENYIPKNNWNRYFNDVVDCESEELNNKWSKLHEVRIKVAHNKSLKELDYNTGNELCDFLQPIINDAIKSLDKLEIPEEERESISLNSMKTIDNSIKPFIENYQTFTTGLSETIAKNQDVFKNFDNPIQSIQSLLDTSNAGSFVIANPLKNALDSIELTKGMILSGDNFGQWSELANDSLKLFGEASSSLKNNYDGLTISDNITGFLDSKNDINNSYTLAKVGIEVPILTYMEGSNKVLYNPAEKEIER